MNADGVRVGVVGVEPEAVTTPPGVTVTAETDDVTAVVAVGESALLSARSVSAPLLPVDAGAGVRSVPRDRLYGALGSVADDDHSTWTTRELDVTIDGEQTTSALLDVMLVTEAPANISEFTIESATDELGSFRADGVLLASAPGTPGYARRVGAPVLDPALPVGAVVPIAPFATRLDHWVVGTDSDPILTATIEREEAVVELLADDRRMGSVPAHTPITISPGGTRTLCSVPESRSAFESR